MELQLIHSKAQRHFKKKMGQANHFLITILIGLDEVGKGTVKRPATLDASWNPKDVYVSAVRSREYALNASLAWIVDCFDAYVQNCKRKPSVIENQDFLSEIDRANRSVNEKFEAFFDRYEKKNKEIRLYGALLALGIQWRNVTTHSEADNTLEKDYCGILQDNKAWYYDNFCHLKVVDAIHHFNEHKSPTLKETTSIIKAVLRFTELIDSELIKEINTDRYLTELLEKHFSGDDDMTGPNQLALFKTLTKDRQLSRIKNILLNNGFVENNECGGYMIDDAFIDKFLYSK